MAATHANQVETVRALIAAAQDINIRDDRLDNPFLYASAEGLFEIVQLTIEAKADTRLTNRFGGTALIPAAEAGMSKSFEHWRAPTWMWITSTTWVGPLLEAIILSDGGERHQQIVQILVDHGANITIPTRTEYRISRTRPCAGGPGDQGDPPLAAEQSRGLQLIHAEQGDLESVRRAIGQGASVEVQDENGRTA